MSNAVVIGAQWGDEGKAKIIDYLTRNSDIIIRFQGGANAGHTVVVDGEKYVFHMVPSGIIYPSKVCVIGNGVVFDAEQFLCEIKELQQRGIELEKRVLISDCAHLVLPYHKILDSVSESHMKNSKIGTTGRGIGPAYADKAYRTGIRTGDLYQWDHFVEKLTLMHQQKNLLLERMYDHSLQNGLDETIAYFKDIRDTILPYITDTSGFIFNQMQKGKTILFEGAQGTLLDIDHGTYPFVTSSSTVSGAACTGAGVAPSAINHVIGIVKAYTTRVGNGPFPTELSDETGKRLQSEGNEFGATTGRPRRCGWLDSVALRKSIQLNGFTRIALTKLDVLNNFDEIPICTHYELNGKKVEHFPSIQQNLGAVKPIYEYHAGWKSDIAECKKFSDLPQNAIKYVQRIRQLCYNVPFLLISVGSDRNQTIEVEPV